LKFDIKTVIGFPVPRLQYPRIQEAHHYDRVYQHSSRSQTLLSARAGLAAIGLKMRQLKLFKPITQLVTIAQKKVKYSPTEKLLDGFIAILAGAHGLVEIDKQLP
jgi:hypothetical protein